MKETTNKTYSYELWDGTKVVGHHVVPYPFEGTNATFSWIASADIEKGMLTFSPTIVVPITYRTIFSDSIDVTIRKVLDVSKLNKKQIKLLSKQTAAD